MTQWIETSKTLQNGEPVTRAIEIEPMDREIFFTDSAYAEVTDEVADLLTNNISSISKVSEPGEPGSYFGDAGENVMVQVIAPDNTFEDLTVIRDASAESVSTDELSNYILVSTQTELYDAIGTGQPARLTSDILTTTGLSKDVGDTDVLVDFNGYELKRDTDHNERQFQITTTGNVEFKNGRVDGNRSEQSVFNDGQRPAELRVENANEYRVQNMTIVNNAGWSVESRDCDYFDSEGVRVDTNPSGLGPDAGGLDGIHVRDAITVSITGGSILAGDDGIAVDVVDSTTERVNISGVNVSSPENANGIKLFIHPDATNSASLKNIDIDATISDCEGLGVVIKNEADNGTPIENINISGVIENTRREAIGNTPGDPLKDVTIDATIRDCFGYGIYLRETEDITVDSTINIGAGDGEYCVDLEDCMNAELSGTYMNADSHGVQLNGTTTHVAVNATIRGYTFNPVNLANNADYVVVVGCDLDGNPVNNGSSAANLITANNL